MEAPRSAGQAVHEATIRQAALSDEEIQELLKPRLPAPISDQHFERLMSLPLPDFKRYLDETLHRGAHLVDAACGMATLADVLSNQLNMLINRNKAQVEIIARLVKVMKQEGYTLQIPSLPTTFEMPAERATGRLSGAVLHCIKEGVHRDDLARCLVGHHPTMPYKAPVSNTELPNVLPGYPYRELQPKTPHDKWPQPLFSTSDVVVTISAPEQAGPSRPPMPQPQYAAPHPAYAPPPYHMQPPPPAYPPPHPPPQHGPVPMRYL
jgi:hypothetical protein